MSYTKTNWEALPSTNTPIIPANLNKIENRIEELNFFQPHNGDTTVPKSEDGFRPIVYAYDTNNPIVIDGVTFNANNTRVEGSAIQTDNGAIFVETGVVTFSDEPSIQGKLIYRYKHGSFGTNSDWVSIEKNKNITKGFRGGQQFSYTLEGFKTYLLISATVGNSNLYDPYAYIIMTGQGDNNSGAIIELGNNLSGTNKPTIALNGLTLVLTMANYYNIITLSEIG